MKEIPLLLLIIGGIIVTGGDIIFKQWVITHKSSLYVLGLLVWLVGVLFLIESFKYKNIAVASLIFTVVNVVALIVISWIFFKEPLRTMQIVGILLGFTAIALLEIG